MTTTSQTTQRVAFIGLGAMGSRMAPHLAQPGTELFVYDVDPETTKRVAEQAGATVLGSVDDAADADVVVLMLPTSDVIDSLLLESDDGQGLLARMSSGSYLIDMSSSDPLRTRANAPVAEAAGVHLVDAPVSGGIGAAEKGSLAIMAGAADEDYQHVLPLLEKMGGAVSHVGSVGSGHALKALNNLLAATILAATAEAFTAGERFGLDPVLMREAVGASSGGSFVSNTLWPIAIENGSFFSGFRLALMEKDVRIGSELLKATDTDSPVCAASASAWALALAETDDVVDMAELARRTAARKRSDS